MNFIRSPHTKIFRRNIFDSKAFAVTLIVLVCLFSQSLQATPDDVQQGYVVTKSFQQGIVLNEIIDCLLSEL